MTTHPELATAFASAAIERKPNGEQNGFCLAFPPAIAERFIEDDTRMLHFEIVRLTTSYHVKLVEEIPENPDQSEGVQDTGFEIDYDAKRIAFKPGYDLGEFDGIEEDVIGGEGEVGEP